MTRAQDALPKAVAAHRWLQSLRLRPNLVTPGVVGEAHLLAEEEAIFGPLNLSGAHVLEVGAANGYLSFAALRRGATRVLATDHLAWTLPGADAQAATELAAREMGLGIETMALDPRALTAEFGKFDVVVATAFFEQLFNPIAALRGLRAVTTRLLLIETLQDAQDDGRPVMMAQTLPMPFGGPSGAMVPGWAPNPPAVLHLLHTLGFSRILYRNHPTLGSQRGIFAALLPAAPEGVLEGFGEPWINLTHPKG
ncbi:MAG: hypothetical protein JWR10_2058 [Rubritepida sp.]|nr:hypothetical protein [Rubritepida sp.]